MRPEALRSKTVVQVYLTRAGEFYNPVSEIGIDLEDCTEFEGGVLLDPDGFEIEILN